MSKTFQTALLLTLVLLPVVGAHAQDTGTAAAPAASATGSDKDLLSLDLNDLMNIKVTTASKTAESFNKVAASLYVVTAEDIRRSGAQTIPEALRLVPGVDVAQLNSGQYAVSIRGFNAGFSDKLLVLVDGRTIYNNLFGGVYWEDQQIPMETIDRIEVIRGPGTASWGANAVQGIINIITKSAKDTQGASASVEYGDTNDKDQQQVGYGGSYGKDGYYRVFAKSTDRSDGLVASGDSTRDSWIDKNAGFRLDQGSDDTGKLQVSGDLYRNTNDSVGEKEIASVPYEQAVSTNYPDSGGDLLGHWEKLQPNGSTLALQADYTGNIHYIAPLLTDNSKTTNIDVQDTLAPRGQHSIIIGLGYTNDGSVINGLQLIGTPKFEKTEVTGSGFVQDQITFSKTLSAQVGSKFENNNFTGWEYEPSAHLGYSPNDQHTLWTSASRAVEIPSLQELGFPLNVGVSPYPVGPNTYIPLSEFFEPAAKNDSQIVAAYEAGYRVQATTGLMIDLSVFYNEYSQLLGVKSFGTPIQSAGPPPGLVVPFTLTNIGSGSSSGGEVASHIKLSPDWRVNVGYSYVTAHIAPSQYASLFDTPTSQLEIQSYRDLTKKLEFDSAAYFVAANKQDNSGSYTKLDLRLGYKPTSKIEISVGGNNLLKNEYAQFGSSSPLTTYLVQREFYTKISWKY